MGLPTELCEPGGRWAAALWAAGLGAWLLDGAPEGADHTLRDRRPTGQRQGIADSHDPSRPPGAVRVAQLSHWQVVALNLDHRQVRLRVSTDELGRKAALVRQRYEQLLSTLDDVVIGENVALAVIDDTGSNAGRHDEGLIELARLDFLLVRDLDHRWLYLLADRADSRQKTVARRAVSSSGLR